MGSVEPRSLFVLPARNSRMLCFCNWDLWSCHFAWVSHIFFFFCRCECFQCANSLQTQLSKRNCEGNLSSCGEKLTSFTKGFHCQEVLAAQLWQAEQWSVDLRSQEIPSPDKKGSMQRTTGFLFTLRR